MCGHLVVPNERHLPASNYWVGKLEMDLILCSPECSLKCHQEKGHLIEKLNNTLYSRFKDVEYSIKDLVEEIKCALLN